MMVRRSLWCLLILVLGLLMVSASYGSDEEDDLYTKPTKGNLTQKDIIGVVKFIDENFYEKVDKIKLIDAFKKGVSKFSQKRNVKNPLKSIEGIKDVDKYLNSIDSALSKAGLSKKESQPFLRAGIKAMVDSLGDKGCIYKAPGKYRMSLSEMGYNKGGCGFFADDKPDADGRFIVIDTLQDFPAEKQGLKPGDRIVKVNGKSVKGKNFYQLGDIVRGPVGTYVVITVYRPTLQKEIDIKIRRTWLAPNANSLSYKVLEGNIGYIKFRFLGERMIFNLEDVYKEFAKKGVKKIIWDFRNCAGQIKGGLELASHFVPDNKVFAERVYREGVDKIQGLKRDTISPPSVVITNKYTPSACAVLVLVLQKYHHTPIVGSSCKWHSDLSMPHRLKDGSVIILTYGYYKICGKTLKDESTIKPDVEISQHPFPPFRDGDKQLKKAIEVLNK